MTTTESTLAGLLDTDRIRADFPILSRRLADGRPLVYLDSANTSQKPQQVLEALDEHYRRHNANVARAVHQLGAEATAAYEDARATVAAFLGAGSAAEVVFTKNASEALNLVANCLAWATGPLAVGPGDEIVITEMEHHSNIVPWQLLAERRGATLRWFGVTDEGRLDLSGVDSLITPRTKVLALVHASNVVGSVNPVAALARRAHEVGALVVCDASQSVPQMPVDVAELGVDFLAFTGHKLYGPSGVGVLWGRYELLAEMPPFLGGGEMIETVDMSGTTYAAPPHRFEAGTPMIAEAVGLGAAVDYVTAIGMNDIAAHEHQLVSYALERLRTVEGLRIVGPSEPVSRGATIAFTLAGVHPHDVAQLLDEQGIAVRAGHHCARPVCVRYGIPATTRASFGIYTSTDDIDALVAGVGKVKELFG